MVDEMADMLPSRLFRSRWSALFWAGGVLWTAYDVASAQRDAPSAQRSSAPKSNAVLDATGEPVDANDLAILANVGA